MRWGWSEWEREERTSRKEEMGREVDGQTPPLRNPADAIVNDADQKYHSITAADYRISCYMASSALPNYVHMNSLSP